MSRQSMVVQATAKDIPLRDNSVQCVVTSPPYWMLRDYGVKPEVWGGDSKCKHVWEGKDDKSAKGFFCAKCKGWLGCLGLEPTPQMYVRHLCMIFREVRRVLRDDGIVWLNIGDTYAMGSGTGQVGPGSMFKKSSTEWHEEAREVKARQQSKGPPPGCKPKDLIGVPWMLAFALRHDGWYLRKDIIWSKPNCMPESVTDRPTSSHEYIFLLSKSPKYFYDMDAIREPHTSGVNKSSWFGGEAGSTDFQSVPLEERQEVVSADADEQIIGVHRKRKGLGRTPGYVGHMLGKNRRSVWTVSPASEPDAHFAVFPEELIRPCIQAGTSQKGSCPHCGAPWKRLTHKESAAPWEERKKKGAKGGSKQTGHNPSHGKGMRHDLDVAVKTVGWEPMCKCKNNEPIPSVVLDPFGGTGTTGAVALKLNRSFVCLEPQLKYVKMMRKRIFGKLPLLSWRP